MIATPASVLATEPVGLPTVCCWSTVSEKLPSKRPPTVVPIGLAVSSGSLGSVVVPAATGASLTGVTVIPSGTTPVLTAVMPPL